MSGPKYPHQCATVKVQIGEPDLVGAAFETVHNLARANNMSDIDVIDVEMTVVFKGSPAPYQLERFKAQVNRLWMAHMTRIEQDRELNDGEVVKL